MTIKTLSKTIDPSTNGRVDAVVRALSKLSHSQVRGLFDHACVSIDSQPCDDAGTRVHDGNVVSVRYDSQRRYRETKKRRWDDRTFQIVFEDDDLIVVDKAAGTLTVPTDKQETNTLVDRVSIYISHSKRHRDAALIHRLDRAVSGLLVFGKHDSVAKCLIEQFKEQKPKRVYAAIVAGVMDTDKGTFRSHLATGKNLDRYETRASAKTETAITHYRVIRKMEDTTSVEVELETGKRNQIRVHFSSAGHPILGDPRYETEKAIHARWIRKRIALHAKSLSFTHPVTEELMTFDSPLPSAMKKFLAGSR